MLEWDYLEAKNTFTSKQVNSPIFFILVILFVHERALSPCNRFNVIQESTSSKRCRRDILTNALVMQLHLSLQRQDMWMQTTQRRNSLSSCPESMVLPFLKLQRATHEACLEASWYPLESWLYMLSLTSQPPLFRVERHNVQMLSMKYQTGAMSSSCWSGTRKGRIVSLWRCQSLILKNSR